MLHEKYSHDLSISYLRKLCACPHTHKCPQPQIVCHTWYLSFLCWLSFGGYFEFLVFSSEIIIVWVSGLYLNSSIMPNMKTPRPKGQPITGTSLATRWPARNEVTEACKLRSLTAHLSSVVSTFTSTGVWTSNSAEGGNMHDYGKQIAELKTNYFFSSKKILLLYF